MSIKKTKNIFIVFGVSGCGKSVVGKELAKQLEVPFYDADDFHPKSNIQKMSDGKPLDDNDRQPWLENLSEEINKWKNENGAVLACSALKNKYREILESNNEAYVEWIFLDGNYQLIASRMESRKGHFFKAAMLKSQFEALEKPTKGISISINQSIPSVIKEIQSKLI